eukprot:GHVU01051250.1.p1 GENE.GHVU01051250.1~~GHVU01051250.1.p1  ORF type:complete len:133 (+),score=1.61 GHVU01051250.1:204-602(+)
MNYESRPVEASVPPSQRGAVDGVGRRTATPAAPPYRYVQPAQQSAAWKYTPTLIASFNWSVERCRGGNRFNMVNLLEVYSRGNRGSTDLQTATRCNSRPKDSQFRIYQTRLEKNSARSCSQPGRLNAFKCVP